MLLALTAGYVVSPVSSMLDQGALHGVRTAALLFEQRGPFHYESPAKGAVFAALDIADTYSALMDLTSDEDSANDA